jgi:hypothetical protein
MAYDLAAPLSGTVASDKIVVHLAAFPLRTQIRLRVSSVSGLPGSECCDIIPVYFNDKLQVKSSNCTGVIYSWSTCSELRVHEFGVAEASGIPSSFEETCRNPKLVWVHEIRIQNCEFRVWIIFIN